MGIPIWRKGLAGDNATCNISSQEKKEASNARNGSVPRPEAAMIVLQDTSPCTTTWHKVSNRRLERWHLAGKNTASSYVFQTKPETVPTDPTHNVSVSIAMRSPSILALMMSQFWSIWQQKGNKILSFGCEKMIGTPS